MMVALLTGASSSAEPAHLIRIATLAPDGTGWAHEMRAFSHEVEAETHDAVRIKWYFGGIAGDDLETGERVKREQLEGVGSGGPLCERVAPSMKALRILGLFRDLDEAGY